MIGHLLYKKLSSGAKTSSILLYHRIADDPIDAWDLCVSVQNFERQLHWLKKNCRVISLEEMVFEWSRKKLKPNSIAITFDDGYLDNYTLAIHLLEKYALPATFFITNERKILWWDELEACLLKTETLPERFHFTINSILIDYSLLGETSLTPELHAKLCCWKAFTKPTTKRAGLLMQVWKQLRFMTYEEQQKALVQIRGWSASKISSPPLMNEWQVKNTSEQSLFEIGAHTKTHPALSSLRIEMQKAEMLENKNYLEEIIGKKVKYFSYPYGDYNEQAINVASESGFEASFTTQGLPVGFCKRIHQLGRYCVTNQNLSTIIKKRRMTFALDPHN